MAQILQKLLVVCIAVAAWRCSRALASLSLNDCNQSDATLSNLQLEAACGLDSSVSPACSKVKTKHDWPNQVVYWQELLDQLVSPETCLNTSAARAIFNWTSLQSSNATSDTFAYTWLNFQVQYYDMPRQPGVRIEAPDTLGRKCWAFAYLNHFWNQTAIIAAASIARVDVSPLVDMYKTGAPYTMELCRQIEENCFINQTYDPTRNGTCRGKIEDFHWLGFERENLLRANPLQYPFY
eukprot:TRINITY_DN11716_c0_g2_i3.p2 TRINITY_DN11716_c0_g2~~TRINITY_DN11716_c0_g2_i3.p2  ORF type:complete len:238 (+),score=16.11 TRINITY_DN11716_c0_g2_i3:1164-1877(+)